MIPVLSLVGKSGVGKTTFAEKLLPELKKRGVRIAVVKHHSHGTPVDVPGKDSWRYADAGAVAVVVSSPAELVHFERVKTEKTLAEIAAGIEGVDLILTEGFKREAAPKIEVSRAELGNDLVARADELIAVVSDHPISLALRRFELDDVIGVADFIIKQFKLVSQSKSPSG
jgi:molybdopterin-guanine dinucleotide biosynthesis adapter protein